MPLVACQNEFVKPSETFKVKALGMPGARRRL
jgi:hypothetical protein